MTAIQLEQQHINNGAKMTDFAGFNMPVWFSRLKDEHLAVRNNAGIFDISHMGLFILSGKDVEANLQRLSCNDINKAAANKMIYSMFLNEQGGILDDVMLGPWGENWLVIVNAGNRPKIEAWINAHITGDCTLNIVNNENSLFAVQGPEALGIANDVFGDVIDTIPAFGSLSIEHNGDQLHIMRTGYTGENGFEVICPNHSAQTLWEEFTSKGVTPCGLAARDSLRLEAGLPLYGNELGEDITPLMTRYRWVLAFDTEFIGKDTLQAQDKVEWTTVGLELNERQIPRNGYEVVEGGKVTSGTLSPSLDKPIAMAMIPTQHKAPGSIVNITIRDRHFEAKVVPLPFVKKKD